MRAALSRLLAAAGVSLLCLAAALAMGCASSPVKITYAEGRGVVGGSQPVLQSVEVTPEAYGRQCFTVETDGGNVSVVYAVDASSDYAGVRALPSILPEMVAAAVSFLGGPFDIVKGLLGIPPREMQAPSALSACSAIFED